jgi:hypothetical protein
MTREVMQRILDAMRTYENDTGQRLRAVYLHPDDLKQVRAEVQQVAIFTDTSGRVGRLEVMGIPVREEPNAPRGVPIFDPPMVLR